MLGKQTSEAFLDKISGYVRSMKLY